MKQITVIGSGGEVSEEIWKMAEEVGRRIAERRACLITGGKAGVMAAACRGAKRAGGLTIGVLPHSKEESNPFVDVRIVTEMGDARNVINVKSADAVISVAGGSGTLSEIALALKAGRKVIALKPSGGASELMAGRTVDGQTVLSAGSVDEAISMAFSED